MWAPEQDQKYPGLQPPVPCGPPTAPEAPEAHPPAHGCPRGPRGTPSPLECRRGCRGALVLAQGRCPRPPYEKSSCTARSLVRSLPRGLILPPTKVVLPPTNSATYLVLTPTNAEGGLLLPVLYRSCSIISTGLRCPTRESCAVRWRSDPSNSASPPRSSYVQWSHSSSSSSISSSRSSSSGSS